MPIQVAIIGGSLCGLAAANALHRLGISVVVFERSSASLETRGSSLGFVDVSLWEHICGRPMMRLGKHASRDQGAFYYGDLWKYLYEGLPQGTVKFNYTISALGEDSSNPSIDGKRYDAAIIADGGWSSLRHYVNGDDKPEYSGMVVWRAKANIKDLPNYNGFGAFYSGKSFSISLPVPTNDGQTFVMGGVAIGTPETSLFARPPTSGAARHTETEASCGVIPHWFIPFIQRTFTQVNYDLVRWLEVCATKGKITPQPLYEFKAKKVVSGRLVIIGDAAHMASPRTAAGAHTGMLDVAALLEAFDTFPGKDNIDKALSAYAPGGVQRAKQLYERSIEVSNPLKYAPGDIYPGDE